ncbi:hypothetical protein PF004_g19500 [Phytophthora fragariae]|uniref:RNA-directed DNA polymerase n=1 Tax=Phytophthora fragariae TaxID=53985 RepID=A0A6G0N9B6_9STRA|nr:hypothetical protein PF004_g19500 [Phytophthora fragariae]
MPYDWQNKYDASGQVYTTVAALVPFFERIEQGEQRLHRAGSQDKGSRHDNSRGHGRRNNNNNNNSTSYRNGNNSNSNSNNRQQHQRGRNPGRGNGNNNSHTSSNKYCTFHRATTHNTADCRALRHDNQQEEHQQADQRHGPRAAQPPQQHQQTRVVQRQTEGSSSDDEYLFVGLNASPTSSPPPMRVMIKLEAGKDRFQALLDSGCSRSIVSSAFMELLQQKQGATLENSQVSFMLVKGNTKSTGATTVRFRIPQLKRDSVIIHKFEVLPTLPDDMTIGRDLMSALGLVIDFKNGRITWDGSELVVRTTEHGPAAQDNANDEATLDEDDELCAGDDCATTPEDLLPQHLEAALEHCYLKLLEEYVDLYSGRLGRIRLDDYVLPLRADYTPSHARPYSVPRSQEEAARREIQKLLDEDVIEQIYGSEAAAPAFFLVKPNGSLRLLVDFRELNKFLRRSPYYVPKIREILLRLGKAKCMSTLDANMGYFARRLARQSRAVTAFCLPFGKFQFKRLPMGISTAPDEYQACMERILGDLDFVIVYLDDILIFSENPVEHLEHLQIVFDQLRQFDVTLNGKKCHILRDRVDYLGFTLTPEGIQPQTKKVEAIQQIAEPRNKRELRRFLGMIAYYRDMVPNKSALTARLNRLTSKTCKFTWTPEDSAAFRSIKEALARSVWLAFPDYSRRFHVFADASGHQIGGVIVQGRRILACFSRAMTDTQKKYSTMEWELLSVVEILKEYRTMLLGFPVVIHTDHTNLLFPRETSLRVKRWKLLLEEYRLEVVFIPGSQNIGADAFSRLRYDFVKQVSEEGLCAVEEEEVAIDGAVVKKHQLDDATGKSIIEQLETKQADPDYALRPALGVVLLRRRSRIMVPESLRADLVEMYHSYLLHPGADKQYHTMSVFWWPGMEKDVTDFVKACNDCKRAKLHGGKQNYGHLPPTPVTNTDRPIDVIHVDLLGPISGDFYCLTAIEQQFRWLEVIIQRGKTSATTAISFERVWLCRYPRPKRVVYDLGPEITGDEFQLLLKSMAIKDKPITAKNPQANAICERVHLELMNILRVRPDLHDQLETALDYAAYAIRASYHSILRASPAQLLFGEDMLTRHLHFANWNYLSKQRFMAILQDNDRENLRRVQHFYREGDTVMLRIPARERKKTDPVAKGPFVIKTVFDNGTVLLDTGATEYRTSIRRIFHC